MANGTLRGDCKVATPVSLVALNTRLLRTAVSTTPTTPPEFGDLRLWLDASDTSTIDIGLRRWYLKFPSGPDEYIAANSGTMPSSGTRTINGLNVLDFDASNDQFSGSTAMPNSQGDTGPVTTWIVLVCDSTAGAFFITLWGGTDYLISKQAGGVIRLERPLASGGDLDTPGSSFAAGTPFIIKAIADGANSSLRVNSVTTTGTVGSADLQAGESVSVISPGGPNLAIGEILHYVGAMRTTDGALVDNYLTAKWGVTP